VPVIFTTSFLAIGTIREAVGKATGKEVAQAFIQSIPKFSINPTLIAIMEKDMTRLMPKEMIRLIRSPAYFG